MDRWYMAIFHVIYGLFTLCGSVFFLWFCWPAVFKGVFNTGNLCGMLLSVLMVLYGIRYRQIHQLIRTLWHRQIARVCLLAAAVLAFIGIVCVFAASVSMIRAASKNVPDNTPAIVLGCSVIGTRPSRILQERIDAAYVYLKEHPKAVCILSGGKGEGEDISEAECMYRELKKAGIDDSRLYLEDTSVNTQQNMEHAHEILEEIGCTDAVTIISSEFHLYRARQWAKALGYENYGYAAHTDWRYLPTFFLREVIAVCYLWVRHI